ncbi:MAG: matrixin family metalloprotease [Myxococcota bacterium]
MSSPLSRRVWLGATLGLTLASRVGEAAEQSATTTVALLPLGPFPAGLLGQIDSGLQAELGCKVVRYPTASLPPSAYYRPRQRYRAEKLLVYCRDQRKPPATKILGVTTVDISTTARGVYDWGVLGLGQLGGPACVMSTFRCRRRATSEKQVNFRMVTTCIHEVGHTLGLDHCADTRCLMTDAHGSVLTVDKTSGHLCSDCRQRLGIS